MTCPAYVNSHSSTRVVPGVRYVSAARTCHRYTSAVSSFP